MQRKDNSMYYSILFIKGSPEGFFIRDTYVARYKSGGLAWPSASKWTFYADGIKHTWEDAYAVLEQHANPAALVVRFVGTF
jgi:hypothetical protein